MTTLFVQDGFKIGKGINPNTGEIKGEAIDTENVSLVDPLGLSVATIGEEPPEGGIHFNAVGSADVYLKLISSKKELRETMDVSATASIEGIEISGSAEAKFIKSTNISSSSIYALVYVTVKTFPIYLKEESLTQEAADFLQAKGWDEFDKRYGPEFISGIKGGGFFYALIEITASNSQKSQAISAKINASYSGVIKADASVTLANDIHSVDSEATTKVTVHQRGGDPNLETPTTIEGAIKFAASFAKQVTPHPDYCQVITSKYKNLKKLPPVIEHPDVFNNQHIVLDGLGEAYEDIENYVKNIDFVLSHFESFKEFGVTYEGKTRQEIQKKLNDSKKEASEEMNKISNDAINCSKDSSQCKIYTSKFIKMELPGGDLMYLKELEEKLAQLTTEVEHLKQNVILKEMPLTIRSFSGKYLNTNDDSKETVVPANYIIKDKSKGQDPGQYEIMKIYRYGAGW